MPAVHTLFEADSDLACALLDIEAAALQGDLLGGDVEQQQPEDDLSELAERDHLRPQLLVAAFDAIAAALGLDATARADLARRRRAAHAPDLGPHASDGHDHRFRVFRPGLRRLLAGHAPAAVKAAFSAYLTRARAAGVSLDPNTRDRVLPPLLHLSAVRLMGLDRDAEIEAYTFWDRTLESLARHPVTG